MELPKQVSLPARRIWDQGTVVNCCLSCALGSCLEALRPESPALAPLFHYWWARSDRHSPAPLTISRGFFTAQLRGYCRLPLHAKEFTLAGISEAPREDANQDARFRQLGVDPSTWQPLCYWLPRSQAERYWKKALALGYPVLLGLHLDQQYHKLRAGGADTWEAQGPSLPGAEHAVAVLGYEDAAHRFVIQDSRGPSFGKDGQWFLSYDAAASNSIYAAYAIGVSPTKGLHP